MMILQITFSNSFNLLFLFCTITYCTKARPQHRRTFHDSFQESRINRSSVNGKISVPVETQHYHHHHHNLPVNKSKTRILSQIGKGGFEEDFQDRDIIFPDSYQIIFETTITSRIDSPIKPPSGCLGDTICEDVRNYPYNKIREILKKKHVHKDFFGRDEIPAESLKPTLINRNGDDEDFVCASLQRTVFPKVGKNKNNEWKYIINQDADEGYVQGVGIETCRETGVPCAVIGELPNGYITSCKQKYIYRRLISISNTGEPTPDSFMLPSACCCSYRRDVSIFGRFTGAQVTPVGPKPKR